MSTGNARKLIYDQDERFKITDKYFLVFAMNYLGNCYLYGIGVNKSNEDALYWYKKSAAKYNIEATFSLGCLYFEGKGTRKNVKKAIDLWKQTAKFNHKGALYYLGVAYYEGRYVKRDLELAKSNLKKASEQGIEEATQLLNIIKKEENTKK